MNCPKCRESSLREVQAGSGLAVDLCPSCAGVWLDKAEIYRFVKQPHRLYQELSKAYRSVHPSDHSCPRCGKMLLSAKLDVADLMIEACPGCGGTWLDAGEVEKLQAEIARLAPASGGRALTEMETASVFGVDVTAALAVVVAVGGALAAAAGLALGSMRKLPVRAGEAGLFLLAALSVAGLLFLLARGRSRRRKEARLVSGTVTGVKGLASGPWGEVELSVRFSFEGGEFEVLRKVSYRTFSDAREGSVVGVVALPGRPRDAAVVRAP
ncbi:MAG: zf-TFIIB domain-containing protein [Elusimicrobia bacterium]|nr:zf-TFIIB domain-containing protein [Elusimicrobiota bacterium]